MLSLTIFLFVFSCVAVVVIGVLAKKLHYSHLNALAIVAEEVKTYAQVLDAQKEVDQLEVIVNTNKQLNDAQEQMINTLKKRIKQLHDADFNCIDN